jgi:transposase-like protein
MIYNLGTVAMQAHLNSPIFQDENAAREWLEMRIWPNGPFCPHCGSVSVTGLHGKAHRPGLYQCNDCREQFTVTVGTVAERSKIALNKWVLAIYLMSASKKGMSAHQMHRMLGISYKSTWFMCHRIREAMREGKLPGGLGGANKVVEIDETYVGGKEANKHAPSAPMLVAGRSARHQSSRWSSATARFALSTFRMSAR